MKLSDLAYVPEHNLPAALTLYRVQRSTSRPGTVRVGALRLPPAGTLAGRFDLARVAVGYFGEAPETAVYEALARREVTSLSVSLLTQRSLLALQTQRTLRLADLRPHAPSWPFLQSLRLHLTQQVADDAHKLGFEGVIYRSAQQYAHDCYAIFGPALRALKLIGSVRLVNPAGGLHRCVTAALIGSQVPLVP
ncbi:RES family NAD+ phosphorylase [Piscinibacter sp.]|uniref:RES family NAD+ phosphorylase n=1 Tax=Piscinibacter sp. TaxID=1903157 RepID=UPI0039E59C74